MNSFQGHSLFEIFTEKSQQVIRSLYPMTKRKTKLKLPNKILLCKLVCRPIITYGCPVWRNCAQTH